MIIHHYNQVTCSRISFQGPALRSCWTRSRRSQVDIPSVAHWHCGGNMKHLRAVKWAENPGEVVGKMGSWDLIINLNLTWNLPWGMDIDQLVIIALEFDLGEPSIKWAWSSKKLGFSRLITNGDAKGDISGYKWRIWRFTQWKRRVHDQVNVKHYIYIYIPNMNTSLGLAPLNL